MQGSWPCIWHHTMIDLATFTWLQFNLSDTIWEHGARLASYPGSRGRGKESLVLIYMCMHLIKGCG